MGPSVRFEPRSNWTFSSECIFGSNVIFSSDLILDLEFNLFSDFTIGSEFILGSDFTFGSKFYPWLGLHSRLRLDPREDWILGWNGPLARSVTALGSLTCDLK
jgi:hypothetical protein